MSGYVSLGWSAISWIEHYLVHGPGDVQGQPVELDDEFAAHILKAYRLDPATGARLVRRDFLSRAKGRSKSGLAAFIACFEALGPCRFDHFAEAGEVSPWGYEYDEGEPVGAPLAYVEVLCVATEEGQAGNTYDAIHYILSPETCSAGLLADYPGLDVGLTRVILPGSRGYMEPVSSADSSKDGGKSTFIVADETHLWVLPRLKRLHRVMVRNLLKRKIASGWMLETSTMYGAGEGSVAEGTHAYALGRGDDPSLLFDHRQADDKWDLTDPAQRLSALREAYGPASEWMNLHAIADTWDDPQSSEAEFRRYWCNQPVPMVERATSILPKWPACLDPDRDLGELSPSVALAVSFDRQFAAIGAAALDDDVLVVKPLRHGSGLGWVVDEAAEVCARLGVSLVVDERGPAASLGGLLEAAGVRVRWIDSAVVCDSAALLFDRVAARTLAHAGYPELDAAVDVAAWRSVGERRAFGRRASAGDISPLEAISLAGWAAVNDDDYDVMDSIG